MSAPGIARKPPRAVIASVVLLGLLSAYSLIWALNPVTRHGVIMGAVAAASIGVLAFMLLRGMPRGRDIAVALAASVATGGVLHIAATPVRAAAGIAYGVTLVAALTVPKSMRDWFYPGNQKDVTTP